MCVCVLHVCVSECVSVLQHRILLYISMSVEREASLQGDKNVK